MRREVLERDKNRCAKCGTNYNLILHHIRSRFGDGEDTMDNLIVLCRTCHYQMHELSDLDGKLFGDEYLTYEQFKEFLQKKDDAQQFLK
jgi:5-methylcytosine-specific restriction endonuclease McrA